MSFKSKFKNQKVHIIYRRRLDIEYTSKDSASLRNIKSRNFVENSFPMLNVLQINSKNTQSRRRLNCHISRRTFRLDVI